MPARARSASSGSRTSEACPASGPILGRRALVPSTMARTRLPAGFAGVDPPERWTRTVSSPDPAALELSVETLAGVGPTAKRRLARLGLRTVGDLLAHRPRRFEQPSACG